MDEKYYAAELAGYCNRMTAWKIIKDVSEELLAGKAVAVSPFRIEIKENGGFALVKKDEPFAIDGFVAPEITDNNITEASQVWALAASVFYIVMGCQIMNGKGGRGQLESSKIPYMRSEMPQLSELIQKCLNYHPELRPSLEKVHETALEQMAQCDDTVRRGPKFNKKNNPADSQDVQKDDIAFWPETMQPAK